MDDDYETEHYEEEHYEDLFIEDDPNDFGGRLGRRVNYLHAKHGEIERMQYEYVLMLNDVARFMRCEWQWHCNVFKDIDPLDYRGTHGDEYYDLGTMIEDAKLCFDDQAHYYKELRRLAESLREKIFGKINDCEYDDSDYNGHTYSVDGIELVGVHEQTNRWHLPTYFNFMFHLHKKDGNDWLACVGVPAMWLASQDNCMDMVDGYKVYDWDRIDNPNGERTLIASGFDFDAISSKVDAYNRNRVYVVNTGGLASVEEY